MPHRSLDASLKQEEDIEDLRLQLEDLLDEECESMHDELQRQINEEIDNALQKEIDDALQKQIDEALDKEMNCALEVYNKEMEDALTNRLAADLQMTSLYDRDPPVVTQVNGYLNIGSQK